MKSTLTVLVVLAVLFVLPPAATAAPAETDYAAAFEKFASERGDGSESERLKKLFDLDWAYSLQESKEMGVYLGLPGRYPDWSDTSFAAQEKGEEITRKLLKAIRSIDRSQLTPSEQVLYDLYRRRLQRSIEGLPFPAEYMMVNQMGGPQQWIPQFLAIMPARTVEQYEDIVARLRGLPRVIDDTIALPPKGARNGRDAAARDPARRARPGEKPDRRRSAEEPDAHRLHQAPGQHRPGRAGAADPRGRARLRRAGRTGLPQAPPLPDRDLYPGRPRVDRHERPAGRQGLVRLQRARGAPPPT